MNSEHKKETLFDDAYLDFGTWYINGEEEQWPTREDDEEEDPGALSPFDDWVSSVFAGRERCPYCNSHLHSAKYIRRETPDLTTDPKSSIGDDDGIYTLWACSNCAYWQWHALDYVHPQLGGIAASIARRFEESLPNGCHQELAQHLRRNPGRWHDISPVALEKLVAEIFRANYKHAEVMHVGKPGDQGVDVVFIDADGLEWLVQVKRRKKGASEGFETLQKLLGTLFLKDGRHGIIATTADHFTYHVYENLQRASERGVRVELLDKGRLDRMLTPLLPIHPWREHLSQLYPLYRADFGLLQPDIESSFLAQLPKLPPK